MPATVARQREILQRMVAIVDAEPTLRWFELGCSLGRGAGDELSDIDCAVGVADDSFGGALALGDLLAVAGGSISDQMRQTFQRPAGMCWHVHTLYPDGAQLSLVLMPASWRTGRPPGSVVLYDADGVLSEPMHPAAADTSDDTRHEWACLAWIALGDLAKYLDRGSLWEAYQRLHAARDLLWQLWNLARGIEFAGYGVTALLDEPAPVLPPRISSTIAALDATDLRRAARATARLLDEVVPLAVAAPPTGFRDWVFERLGARPRPRRGHVG
jgi:hypothetical protein